MMAWKDPYAILVVGRGAPGFDDELAELIRDTPLWRERDELLRSVPGVGKVLSSTRCRASTPTTSRS
jgi:hypothetical protein